MNKSLLLLTLTPFLNNCGSDAIAAQNTNLETQEPPPNSCTGFEAPNINVFVRNSLDEAMIIDSAHVSIHSFSVNSTHQQADFIEDATFIPDEDNNAQSQKGAYWTTFGANEQSVNLGITVSAPNYHTFVTKNIAFEIDTKCGSNNSITYTAYLCPLGSSCL